MEKEAKPHCSKPHRKSGCQADEDHHHGVQVGHRRPSSERIAHAEQTPTKARVSLIGVKNGVHYPTQFHDVRECFTVILRSPIKRPPDVLCLRPLSQARRYSRLGLDLIEPASNLIEPHLWHL
jgi:hypothetical protein